MRVTKGGLMAAAVMLAGCASADLIPRQDYVSDVSKPTVSKSLTFRQSTSQNLGWTYKQGSTAKDLSSATLVTFTYVPYDRSWSQVVTGALDVATNGSVLVTFTPAQLNTNSGARPFDWLLEVTDGTRTLGYSYGKLTLLADPTSGVTNTFPTVTTTVDWADVAAYTATAASGPVRPGTGITTVTNADGSITISAASGGTGDLTKAVADVTYAPISVVDTTYTNYLAGDTEIVVTGDSRSGSNVLSIGSTITRDTELTAVQDTVYPLKVGNDLIGYNVEGIQVLPAGATAVATLGGGSVSPYAGGYTMGTPVGYLPHYANSDGAYIVWTSGVWAVCYPNITTIVGTNVYGERSMEGTYVALAGQWDSFVISRQANTDLYVDYKPPQGTTFPAHVAGRLFYHSTSNKLFCSDGTAWNALW